MTEKNSNMNSQQATTLQPVTSLVEKEGIKINKNINLFPNQNIQQQQSPLPINCSTVISMLD